MGRRLTSALRLLLAVQWRSRFPHIYLGTALLTVVALRFALPPELAPLLVPALVAGEIAALALYLVAAHRYLESSERSVTALVVTPLRSREYVAALAVASALVATVSGALIQGAVMGVDRSFALTLPPIFLTASLFGLLGLALSAWFEEFTRFILGSIPPFLLLAPPFLAYFELAPRALFVWIPSDAAIFGLANAAAPKPDALGYALYVVLLAAWNAAAFALAHGLFRARVRGRLEQA